MKQKHSPFAQNRWRKIPANGFLALSLVASIGISRAADVFKANNTDNLNLGTSWDGSATPGSGDVAVWDNRVTAANVVSLGASTNWAGIRIADPAGAVTITNSATTLTLGALGIDTTGGSQILTLSCPVIAGAEQNWNLVSGVTLSGGLSGSNSVTLGSGILTINGGTMTLSNLVVNAGTVSISVGGAGIVALNGGTFSVNGAINEGIFVMAGGGTEQNTGGNRTWSGSLSGSGPLTVIASSTHTWSGNNTNYSGTLTLQGGGQLRLSSVNAVSAATTYSFNGGTMTPNVASSLFQLGSLGGGSGTLNTASGQNFLIGALGTDTDFGGVIAGAGMIFKAGTGTLTLSGANTFSGATTISNGVLQIGNGGSTGKLGTGAVTNYSKLVFNLGSPLVVPNAITGSGSVSNIGSGKITLTGANTYTGPTTVTSGALAFGTASLLTGDVTVADSAGAGAVVTSSGATLTQGNISLGSGSTYDFDLGTFGNHPGTVVTNTGTVTLNGSVTVNLAGTNFSVGTVTLLRYANRSGAGSFVLGSLPPNVNATLNDDQGNKRLTLTITSVVVGADTTFRWVGNSVGDWDIDNLANQIWRIVGTGQITNYTEGAAVLFDDTATGTTNINLTTTVNPSTVTVNNTNKTYTFGGVGAISGATGLTKSGPGTLIITNANSYSGPTLIQSGTVIIAGDTGAISSPAVTNNGALVIDRTAASNSLPSTMMFFGQIAGSGGLRFLGIDSTNSIVELEIGTAEGNPYSGGTAISNGFVRLNANPSSDATRSAAKSTGVGSGSITFLGNSVLELEDFGIGNNTAQGGTFAPALAVPSGQIGTLRTAGRMTVSSALTGAGTFNLVVSYVRCVISGDFSAFTGQMNVFPSPNATGNQYQIGNATGLPSAKVHLASGVTMGGNSPLANNSTVPIGELSAEAGSFINTVGESARTVNFSVGGLNTSAAFAGNIGGPHSLTKVGTGTLTLSGTNDFTGTTTISNGVMALTGETGISNSAAIRISSPGILNVSGRTDGMFWLGTDVINQSLNGNGTIQGALTVGSLGSLAPGFGIGTLTVSGSVALSGSTTMELNRGVAPNSDRIVAPSIAAGGALVVTNIGAALQAGDTFQLFSSAVSGTFASVSLPTNDVVNQVSYTWNNKLAVDGTIVLLTATSAVNQTPTNILFSTSAGSIDLQWPTDHIGWTLQTNSVGLANTNAWFPYPGSDQTNRVILSIDPSRTNVFYRLVYP